MGRTALILPKGSADTARPGFPLLCGDLVALDDPIPLGGFRLHEFGEIGPGQQIDFSPLVLEDLHHFRCLHDRRNLVIELVDDRLRGPCRGVEPSPDEGLIPGNARLGDRRDVRQHLAAALARIAERLHLP